MAAISDNMRGAFLMATCMVAFTVNDAFMKAVMAHVPLFQAIFLRGLMTSALLLIVALKMGALRLPPARRDRRLIALRSLAEIASAGLFIFALSKMPLANVSAIMQVLPLTVTLASALFFAEPLGWKRLTAIAIGFCGVLLIVRPGTEGFNIHSLAVLGAVVAVTVRDLAARRLSRDVPSFGVALAAALGVTLASGLGATVTPWVAVTAVDLAMLGGATVFVIVGYLVSVMAMRVGEIGFIAPFRYTSLIAALVLGWLAFGEWPGLLTLLGALIVVATGLFTLYREHMILRRARAGLPIP